MKIFLLMFFVLCFSLAEVNGQKDSAARKNIFQKVQTIINPSIIKTVNPINTSIPPDPAYIFGYCAWTDPVTGRKHLVMGRNRTTGEWEYILGYPIFTISFVHRNLLDEYGHPLKASVYYHNGGIFLHTVDSAGNSTSDLQRIAAYSYRFDFNFDRNHTGDPVGTVTGTIRYNPDLWGFEEVIMDRWGLADTYYDTPLEDFPVIPLRWTRRTVSFPGLPDF